jgi:hypothetical protein
VATKSNSLSSNGNLLPSAVRALRDKGVGSEDSNLQHFG